MEKKKRGMEAVALKSERRNTRAKAAFRRKGKDANAKTPGIAIMIGVPKPAPTKPASSKTSSRATTGVQAEIAELKARLASLEAMMDDEDDDVTDDDVEDEDEDEA